MINIAQCVFNDIAKTQNLKYDAVRRQFEANYEDASYLEDDFVRRWSEELKLRMIDIDQPEWRIALVVYELLPLILEFQAINDFVIQVGMDHLKHPIPLIQNTDAAMLWVKREMPFMSARDRAAIQLLLKENLDSVSAQVTL